MNRAARRKAARVQHHQCPACRRRLEPVDVVRFDGRGMHRSCRDRLAQQRLVIAQAAPAPRPDPIQRTVEAAQSLRRMGVWLPS